MHLNSKYLGSLSVLSLLIFTIPMLNSISYTLGSIFLLFISLVSYVLIAKMNKNYASLGALFALVFFSTVALSNLKLMDYQREWSMLTWFVIFIGFFLFELIYELSIKFDTKKIENYLIKDKQKYISNKQMFIICAVMFFLSILGYIITALQCGFIPFFVTDNINAYSEFYTKFLLLSHLCIINIPLSAYLFYKEDSRSIKIILIIYIFIQTFVLPILAVNRGIFLIGAITLSCTLFYLYNQRLSILIICLTLSFIGYEIGSIGRHYSNELLSTSFNQASVETNETTENSDTLPSDNLIQEEANASDNNLENEKLPTNDVDANQEKINPSITTTKIPSSNETIELMGTNTFVVNYNGEKLSDLNIQIPQRMLFLYSYLTVSHDNFDLAVKYSDQNTFGLRCLSGFDFLLKRIWPGYDNNFDFYQVQFNLNTVNILGTPYYDLKIVGIIIYISLLAFICRIIESLYLKTKNIFSLLLLAQMFYCITLSFFSNYTSQFIFVCSLVSIFSLFILYHILHMIRGVSEK